MLNKLSVNCTNMTPTYRRCLIHAPYTVLHGPGIQKVLNKCSVHCPAWTQYTDGTKLMLCALSCMEHCVLSHVLISHFCGSS